MVFAEYSIVDAVIGIVGAVEKNEKNGSEVTIIKSNPPQINKMAVIAKNNLEFFNGSVRPLIIGYYDVNLCPASTALSGNTKRDRGHFRLVQESDDTFLALRYIQ
jgi:hypothetical protein